MPVLIFTVTIVVLYFALLGFKVWLDWQVQQRAIAKMRRDEERRSALRGKY